jgi:hypothetical protein
VIPANPCSGPGHSPVPRERPPRRSCTVRMASSSVADEFVWPRALILLPVDAEATSSRSMTGTSAGRHRAAFSARMGIRVTMRTPAEKIKSRARHQKGTAAPAPPPHRGSRRRLGLRSRDSTSASAGSHGITRNG